MMTFLFRHSWRELLLRSPARLALLAAYFLMALWSAFDGLAWQQGLLDRQQEQPVELRQERETWMKDLLKVEKEGATSPHQARPMNLSLLAVLPPGPLSMLAHRGENIHPHTAVINGWRSEASLFRRYEVEGPSPLALRGLDLGYLATVVFPLVLLLLTFDALSSERESGRLKLLMVQGLRPAQLLGVRILIPWALLVLSTLLVATLVALWGAQGPVAARLAYWLAAFLLYALFWGGLAALLAGLWKSSTDAAIAALGLWVALVLLLPSCVQFAGDLLYPTPSRVVYLTKARIAEAEARREIDHHAEQYLVAREVEAPAEAGEKVPGYYRKSFVANAQVQAKTVELMEEFEAHRQGQGAVVDRLAFAVPTVLAYRSLQRAAGVGGERAADFRQQARAKLKHLHEVIGPAAVAQRRLSSKEARAIPEFSFAETPLGASEYGALAWMAFLALLSGLWARRVATRVSPL